jgi:hypothetical protein
MTTFFFPTTATRKHPERETPANPIMPSEEGDPGHEVFRAKFAGVFELHCLDRLGLQVFRFTACHGCGRGGRVS